MPSPSTSSTVMLSSPGAIPPKDPEGSAGADPAGAEGSPDGAELAPEEERRALVEAAAMGIPGRDLVELECAVLGDIEVIQAGMVNPETEGEDEEDPLGRGRPGARPC